MTPHPDINALLALLRGEDPGRPVQFEFWLNDRLERRLAQDHAASDPITRRVIAYARAGYDVVPMVLSNFAFPRRLQQTGATISQNAYAIITGRASFESYPWPDPDLADERTLAQAIAALPQGMGLAAVAPDGVLENVTELVGFERLCAMTIDDPDLVDEIFAAVGSRILRYYQRMLRCPQVRIVIGNDDWGHKGGTMLSPRMMRRWVMPWHERIVAAAHAAGRPAILHSCGRIAALMDEVIDGLHYDGKHSQEDVIEPVEEAIGRWGSRITIMGGIDVDFLCRAGPEAVRSRAAALLDRTGGRRYALGSGNSVPSYVPDEAWAAMVGPALARRGLDIRLSAA
jgi:uroporphyrinogen decarboxylase